MIRQRQLGVSLIELMIAVTLVGVVLMIAMPSFSTGVQSRQIRTAAESVQSGLTYARTEALRRNRNVDFTPDANAGWTVGCTTADTATDANGEQACPATLQSRPASSGSPNARLTAAEKTSATGSNASSPAYSSKFTFTPLGRVSTATLTAGNVVVYAVDNPTGGTCVASGGDMRCLSVVVGSNGQIRMCDPAITGTSAVGDPRNCS